jgi:hypothetical protein
VCRGDGNQLLGLRRQSAIGKHSCAERLKGLHHLRRQ